MSGIYVIVRSFSATLNGVPHIFRKGDTVREGHEVFRLYRGSLKEIVPTYEFTPPPPPPPSAPVKKPEAAKPPTTPKPPVTPPKKADD